ncbi:MAG: SOS response-associated peptidase [Phycisphaerales bacterium]
MCGRFTREFTWKQVHDFLNLRFPPVLMAPGPGVDRSYNVAPTQRSAVLRLVPPTGAARESGRAGAHAEPIRELAALRWGLVPAWAKDVSIGSRMINARAETIGEKPAFRTALARRRCVVPMSGFHEWEQPAAPPTSSSSGSSSRARKAGGAAKQPWYIHRADGTILLVAGLWERWSGGTGEGGLAGGRDGIGAADAGVLETFTIVTVPANAFMARLHDRMPAVLEPGAVPRWLDAGASAEGVRELLMPAADGVLTAHRVSTRVNSPRNNEPGLVREEPGGLFG